MTLDLRSVSTEDGTGIFSFPTKTTHVEVINSTRLAASMNDDYRGGKVTRNDEMVNRWRHVRGKSAIQGSRRP